MECGASSLQKSGGDIWPDPAIYLPKGVALQVFSYLKRSDLFHAMQMCKLWKTLAQDESLWQKEFSLCSLEPNSTFSYLSLMVQKDLRIVAKMVEPQGIYVRPQQKEIEKGFHSTCRLHKLGLKTLIEIENYADYLDKAYASDKGWIYLAKKLIYENNFDAALHVINTELIDAGREDITDLFEIMVVKYCEVKEFSKAISLLADNFNKGDFMPLEPLLDALEEANALLQKEEVIDRFIEEEEWRLGEISGLIESYLKANQFEEAIRLIVKYETDLDKAQLVSEVLSVIKIYVRLGQFTKAEKLIKKHEEIPNISDFFAKAIDSCNLRYQYKKTQEAKRQRLN